MNFDYFFKIFLNVIIHSPFDRYCIYIWLICGCVVQLIYSLYYWYHFINNEQKRIHQERSQGGCSRCSCTPLGEKMPGGRYRAKKIIRRVKDFLCWWVPPLENFWLRHWTLQNTNQQGQLVCYIFHLRKNYKIIE